MLYYLAELSQNLSVLNVFRYITFRAGGAFFTALVYGFLFGRPLIEMLRVRQGRGQPIRSDGPESHVLTKAGTPTMGGLLILSALLVSTLLWARWDNGFVAETERQVVEHLDGHLQRLPVDDVRTRAIIRQMSADEERHGRNAMLAGGAELPRPVRALMKLTAKVMTRTAYWI